jgi:Zn finger protein HypA/HybF involved in hydrogenase expression
MKIDGRRRKVMHEVAAMRGMVRTVLECMQQAGASRVTNVQLVLGASGHFTADAAYQHFEALTKGTPIEDASLTIQWLPAKFLCFSCLHRFESCEPATQVTCPICGEVALEIEHKDVCYVSAIDVAFDDAGDTGNTRSIAAEETLPEMHVLSRECYVSTP